MTALYVDPVNTEEDNRNGDCPSTSDPRMTVAGGRRHHRTKETVAEVGLYAPVIVIAVGDLGVVDGVDIVDCNAK